MNDVNKPTIAHICPACINAVFWAHRHALETVLNISNTPGEDDAERRRGMADTAFDCLSFFDLFYDGCLSHKDGTLKDHEIWLNNPEIKGELERDLKIDLKREPKGGSNG